VVVLSTGTVPEYERVASEVRATRATGKAVKASGQPTAG